MKSRVHRATLFVAYQLCILVGIVAMPFAMAANSVGLSLPLHRLIANVGNAYESAS